MQASAQKQGVKRGTTQQTRQADRQGKGVRCTLGGTSCTLMIIFSDVLSLTMAESLCACAKRRWRGRGWRLSRCAGKHFMLAWKLGRHTTRSLSDKGRANFLPRLMSPHFSSTPRLVDVTVRHRAASVQFHALSLTRLPEQCWEGSVLVRHRPPPSRQRGI